MQQAICRIYRQGQQRRRCLILLLTLDGTYDQTLQARAATKMMGQIAGSSNISVSEDEVEAWLKENDMEEDGEACARTCCYVVDPLIVDPNLKSLLSSRRDKKQGVSTVIVPLHHRKQSRWTVVIFERYQTFAPATPSNLLLRH